MTHAEHLAADDARVAGALGAPGAARAGHAARRPRMVEVYFLPEGLRPLERPGQATGTMWPLPCVVALVSTRWTRWLRLDKGIVGEPVYERPALPGEPDTHPGNGHPFAWIYRDPLQALSDEQRLLVASGSPDDARAKHALLAGAIAAVAQRGGAAPAPVSTPTLAQVPPVATERLAA